MTVKSLPLTLRANMEKLLIKELNKEKNFVKHSNYSNECQCLFQSLKVNEIKMI